MATAQTPEDLHPQVTSREVVFEADVQALTPMLKVATVGRQGGKDYYTLTCDEGATLGGLGSAPTPLAYFSASMAF
jgi:hypothetical protein